MRKILVFVSIVVFRIFIVQFAGLEKNGYFQSIFSISNYINVLTNAFVIYLYPTLSSILDKSSFNKEVNKNFEYLFYILFPVVVLIMLFPDIFLRFLYNTSFTRMSYPLSIFAFLKIFEGSYIFFTITFLSATRLKSYIISEVARSSTLIIFSYFAIKYYSLNGAIGSFVLMNLVSFLVVIYFANSEEIFRLNTKNRNLLLKLIFIPAILLLYPTSESVLLNTFKIALFLTITLLTVDLRKYYELIRTIMSRGKL